MSTSRRSAVGRSVGSAVAALTAVAGSLLGASPASAGELCDKEQVCLWEKSGWEGRVYRYDNPSAGDCLSGTATWPGGTSSSKARGVHNLKSGTSVLIFADASCTSDPVALLEYNRWTELPDETRSFRVIEPCASGNVCFWETTGFSGKKTTQPWANFCQDTGGIEARAVFNSTSDTIALYSGSFCLGAAYGGELKPGRGASLTTVVGRWNLA
ncbi:peptidase inhibitor family I36 protein [Streptomyces sp. NPDC059202]|uniref:peptidase inhibitor family I36 protein n=1 Tax=unclassified Streptomyces TaxID=2593676 RepID=UPI003657EFB7